MIVGMWMTRNVIVVEPDTALAVAAQLMLDNKIRRLPVARRNNGEQQLLGILSRTDVHRALPPGSGAFADSSQVRDPQQSVRNLMSQPVLTTSPETPLEDAAEVMYSHKIGALPVVRDGLLVGLVTESDILRAFISVLKADKGSTRVTFAVSSDEDVFQLLADRVCERKVSVSSLMSSRRDNGTVCVARMTGPDVQKTIDDLWKSGHQVINVLHSGQSPKA